MTIHERDPDDDIRRVPTPYTPAEISPFDPERHNASLQRTIVNTACVAWVIEVTGVAVAFITHPSSGFVQVAAVLNAVAAPVTFLISRLFPRRNAEK